MGAPEYPGEGNDPDNHLESPSSISLPMHGINQSEDEDAEMQDSEPTAFDPSRPYAAEGYHPLQFEVLSADDDDDTDDSDEDDRSTTNGEEDATEQPAAPIETTVEREVLNDIWNAPRSADQVDIALDSAKTEQIKSVMSNISLQLAQVQPPDWALNIPESKWIEKLLEDVRNKKSS